ncbi:hypothetical protein RJ639_028106, partial [Escallonia herrerae]
NQNSFMGVRGAEDELKKGPWTAGEDAVLINFVTKNGPSGWSSIRSKGLLPRTGKSCRLRWVNKLRSNLKIGCKFSAEEERVVLGLQAEFGNKWASIASYLPGRTDNDVKNFWSSRQKRLARILRSPSKPSRPMKNKGKAFAVDEIPTLQAPKLSCTHEEEGSSSVCQPCSSSSIANTVMTNMVALPELTNPNLVNTITSIPLLDQITQMAAKPLYDDPQIGISFTQLPILPETHEGYGVGLGESNFSDEFMNQEAPELLENAPVHKIIGSTLGFMDGTPGCDVGRFGGDHSLVNPDSFFEDFPVDMFEYIEPVPSSPAQ